ncbi:MAG: hypothetical protein ACYC9R_13085, partial [Nitrosotalea sp.]
MTIILSAILITFGSFFIAFAAPTITYQNNLFPTLNDTWDLGSTTPAKEWKNVYTKNLTVSGTCTGCSGGSSAFPFTPTSYGVSTSTTVGFTNGLLSTASSTFTSGLLVSNGIVGIGTTSPYSLLWVAGQVVGKNFVSTTTTGNNFMSDIGLLNNPAYSFSSFPQSGLRSCNNNGSLCFSGSGGGTAFEMDNLNITEFKMNATTTNGQVNFSQTQNGVPRFTTYIAGSPPFYAIYNYNLSKNV